MSENIFVEAIHSLISYLKNNIIFNPIAWAIVVVVIWIMWSGFIKAWRGKDEEGDGEN